MNDQSQMMNQHQMSQMVSQQQAPPPPPPQVPPQMAQMYGQWTQQPPPLPPHSMAPPPSVVMNAMKFPNPMNLNPNPNLNPNSMYVSKPGRNNWKGKKPMDNNKRRKDNLKMNMMNNNNNMIMNMYQPPTLYELEQQNRLKARRFYHPKKKFNRMGPYAHAPRNTTSYIIRAKKSGGIASLVSPCPVTPAVLPTPVFSPSREALVDMAKEEWGVDGYGSMKGLIRLRSPGHDETVDDYDEEEEGGSSESDVEEHVEVERRLDHDLSRFEMIYPNNSGVDYHNVLENRVDDQDTHIAQLEEENLLLKERLYLMEREFGEMRRRLLSLEKQNQVVEDVNEEVVENVSENDSDEHRNVEMVGNRDNEEVDFVPRDEAGARRENSDEGLQKELKELTVEEFSRGEAMESHEYSGPSLEGNKRDDGLLADGLGFAVTAANQGVEHEHNQAGEVSEKPVGDEQCESVKSKDLGSADGTKVDTTDDAVKSHPVGDVCMVENMGDEINENDSNGTRVSLKDEDKAM